MPQTIQSIYDENGNATGVIVPISLRDEISSETETAYLLENDAMKKRLLDAKSRACGVSFKVLREKLGL